MTPPSVGCLIVAFHRPESLGGLLASIVDQRTQNLVVNVGDDQSVTEVALAGGAGVVGLEGNPGYAAAVNYGISHLQTEVVVFMNDDLKIEGAAVEKLAAIVASGEAAVAAPAIVNGAGQRERSIMALPTPRSLALEWMATPDEPLPILADLLRLEKWREPLGRERVDAVAATILACHRQLLVDVPLPEDYFMYWEEADWFWTLARRGDVVVYDPACTVRHTGGREDIRADKSRLLARNAVRCVRRTQGRRAGALAWVVVVIWNARLWALAAARRARGGGPGAGQARRAGFLAALSAVREVR